MNNIMPRIRGPRTVGLLSRVLKTSTVSLFVASAFLPLNAQAQWTKMSISATEVQAIAIDPANKNNMFAGTNCVNPIIINSDINCSTASGLYRSINAGSSWSQINDINLKKGIRSIAIAPDNITNKKMFVSVENRGVFKSTNGGANWIAAPIKPTGNTITNLTKNISQLIITNKIGNQQAIYAVISSNSEYQGAAGIYATVNDGVTWTQIYVGADVLKLVVSKSQPGTLYISTGTEIRKATNVNPASTFANVNFTSVTSGLPGVIVDFMMDPSNANYLYASAFGSGVAGFYRSTNGGASWTSLSSKLFTKIAIDTSQSPSKFYGAEDSSTNSQFALHVHSSTNGTSWVKSDINHIGFSSEVKSLVADNSSVYVGVKEGLYKNTETVGTNPGNNNSTALNVRLTVQPTTTVAVGGDITYTMTLQNFSTAVDVNNFTITSSTQFPIGTTKVSDSPINACTITTNRTVSCTVAQLNRSTTTTSTKTITLKVRLPATLAASQVSMLFTANVTGDTNTTDNTNISANTTISSGSNATTPLVTSDSRTVNAGSFVGTYSFAATPVSTTDQLTYIIVSGGDGGNGSLGTVLFNSPSTANVKESLSPSFTYTPKANVTGQDIIKFQVRDNSGRTSTVGNFVFTITSPGSSSPVGGAAPKTAEGGGGAINPILLGLLALVFGVRRFK